MLYTCTHRHTSSTSELQRNEVPFTREHAYFTVALTSVNLETQKNDLSSNVTFRDAMI